MKYLCFALNRDKKNYDVIGLMVLLLITIYLVLGAVLKSLNATTAAEKIERIPSINQKVHWSYIII